MSSSMEKNTEPDKNKHSEFQQNLDYLRQIPLFQGLDFECLKLLAMLSRRNDLVEGDQLITQGEDDGICCYIISGTLQSFHRTNDRDFTVQTYKPGQFIGGLALLGKIIRLFTVQAVTESTVLKLNREGFQKVMNQFPDSMARIGANLAAELNVWEQNILASEEDNSEETANRISGISLL